MQLQQVVPIQTSAPQRQKNCNEWAYYEEPNPDPKSEGDKLCNGGWFRGEWKNECPSKAECRQATYQRFGGPFRQGLIAPQSLTQPRYNVPPVQGAPVASPYAPNVIASTPNMRGPIRAPAPGTGYMNFQSTIPAASSPQHAVMPRIAQQQAQTVVPQMAPQSPLATPYLQTPYMPYHPPQMGGVTPTFLPIQGENVFSRLFRNIMQGFFGAMGWHIFDFSRTVDFFPYIPMHPQHPQNPQNPQNYQQR